MIKEKNQIRKEREAKRLAQKTLKRKVYQHNYRQRKSQAGLVRYELEVPGKIKAILEEMADALSDEMDEDLSYRQRLALAKRKLFVDGIKRNVQAYTTLRSRIAVLEREVTELSPALLPSANTAITSLPEAIQRLPDTPKSLKQLLGQFYKRALMAERKLKDSQEKANRFLELYEVQSTENQRLRKKIKAMGGYVDTLILDVSEEKPFV